MDKLAAATSNLVSIAVQVSETTAGLAIDAAASQLEEHHRAVGIYQRAESKKHQKDFQEWLDKNWRGIHKRLAGLEKEEGGVIVRTPTGFALEAITDPADAQLEQQIAAFEKKLDPKALDELVYRFGRRPEFRESPEAERVLMKVLQAAENAKKVLEQIAEIPDPHVKERFASELAPQLAPVADSFREVLVNSAYDVSNANTRIGETDVVGIYHHHPSGQPPSPRDYLASAHAPHILFSVTPEGMEVHRLHFGESEKIAVHKLEK